MSSRERPAVPQLGSTFIAVALGASLLVSTGCKGAADSTSAGGVGGSFPVDAGSCTPDPLHTGLPPLFNGNSVDMDDCPLLEFTAKYGEPDAMIFKAIIYVESRFQYDAVGCTGNTGCCPQRGWTGAECGCLGSMQTGPWCNLSSVPPGCSASDLGLLGNGHVDLETNPDAGDWADSVFNPMVNIDLGIAGIACNRAQAKAQFPGCTEDQYTMMAVGNFNDYGSTTSCTAYNFTYDSSVLSTYNTYSTAAGWPAHPYVAQ
jgi:hypothetical protein